MSVSQIVPTTIISKSSKDPLFYPMMYGRIGQMMAALSVVGLGAVVLALRDLHLGAADACRGMHKRPKKKGGPRTGQSGRSTSSTLISSISCSIASSRGSIGDRDRDRSKGKGIAR